MTESPGPEHLPRPEALPDESLQQLAARLGAVEQRGEKLGSVMAGLVQEMSTLASQLADLDERLRTVQRLLTEQRTDLTPERALAHLALGEEYTILVTQRFLNVAQQLADPDQPESGLSTAQTVADLCQLLFGDVMPQRHDVLNALSLDAHHPGTPLVLQAVASASTLRERASATPDHIMWDFAIEPDAPINDRQSPWANCAPDLPVRFVVAPAFLVNGTTITHQLVYTSAQLPKLRPPALLGKPRRRKIVYWIARSGKDGRRSRKTAPSGTHAI